MTAIRILSGAVFVLLVSLAAGQLLFDALGLRLRRGERLFLPFLAGAAVLSNLVFALAECGIFYTWVLSVAGAAILAIRWLRRPAEPEPDPQPDASIRWRLLFWPIYLVFGAAYLIAAMAPEISPDGGGGYHLGLVARYYEHRGFLPMRWNMLSGFAEGVEMLFLAAFAFGRHSAAAVTHLLFLLTLPFGIMACGRRAGKPEAGVVAGLLVFLAPVAAKDATCAYVDVATAAVIFGAFCLLEIRREKQDRASLIALGLVAGFGYACKLTAGLAPVCAMAAVAVTSAMSGRGWRAILRQTSVIAALGLALAAPWLIRDGLIFGNPFYPFFNHLFPTQWQYPMVEDEWRTVVADRHGIPLWQIPWELTAGGKFAGIVGPVFLLSPFALLSLRTRFGRLLLAGFVAFGASYFSNVGGRFILSSLPFLALAMALGVLSLPRVGRPFAVILLLAHAALSWPAWISRWSPWFQWKIDAIDPAAALRLTPEEEFISRQWGELAAGKMLDRFVPAADLVYSPNMGMLAYHHRNLVGVFESALGRRVLVTFSLPFTPELAKTWRRELSFAPVAVSRVRLVTTRAAENDLRVSEVRFFRGNDEISRSGAWRIDASANAWEVPLAFDGGPYSWWTSGTVVRPGIWLETDFGRPTEIDRIEVDQNMDERWIPLRPAVQDARAGNWRDPAFLESGTPVAASPDIRMEVRDELKRMGIRWILLSERDPAAAELRRDTPWWGMTEVAQCPGYRLWRLD